MRSKARPSKPTKAEAKMACAQPIGLRTKKDRGWYLQTISLTKSLLGHMDDYNEGLKLIKELEKEEAYKVLGYSSHDEMLEDQGVNVYLAACRAIVQRKLNPELSMREIARLADCSLATAYDAINEAGLKEPTFKEIILRDHIKPDGTLHIGGEKASQREVAKVVGCDQPMVAWVIKNSSTGKIDHPAPSPAMKKVLVLLPKLTNGEVIELIGLAKARLGGL